jgi:hypothetical protein
MAESVLRVNSLISMRLPELKGVRDARGRFTSAQSSMRDRNAKFAQGLQADVVRRIESRITRPGASSGRLLRVTADSGNAQYDTWSIGVGVKSFLNGSIAKYWRTFEEGSAAVWTHPFIGTQLMPKGNNPPYPVAHGQIPGIRTTRKLLPWMDGERFVVKKEIAPRHAYRDAIAEAHPAEFGRANARKLIADILGRELRFNGTG